MKPFITPEVRSDGRKLFCFQCEGFAEKDIGNLVSGLALIRCALPVGHSFQAAWLLRLYFGEATCLEFSSASTVVDGWQEVGSLNIRLVDLFGRSEFAWQTVTISGFLVKEMQKVLFIDDEVVSECGIALLTDDGKEIVIAAGVSPGSVSLSAPFSSDPFEPQFPLEQCIRECTQ